MAEQTEQVTDKGIKKPQPGQVRVGILCAKEHESEFIIDRLKKSELGLVHGEAPLLKQLKISLLLNRDRKLFVFVADMNNRQGPVAAAARVSAFISSCSLLHVGMVGICGGRTLGEVLLCRTAIQEDGGSVRPVRIAGKDPANEARWDEDRMMVKYDGEVFVHDPRRDGKRDSKRINYGADPEVEDCLGKLEKAIFESDFKCYSQVREDAFFLAAVPPPNDEGRRVGVEMEAHALAESVEVWNDCHPPELRVAMLPVIKAVSDVGERGARETENVDEFKRVTTMTFEEAREKYRLSVEGTPGADPLPKWLRKLYRNHAAEAAAGALCAFLKTFLLGPNIRKWPAAAAGPRAGVPDVSGGPRGTGARSSVKDVRDSSVVVAQSGGKASARMYGRSKEDARKEDSSEEEESADSSD